MGNRDKYFGIVPPLMTPLLNAQTLDEKSYIKQIEHCMRGGVHGIFSMGSSGESVHNDHEVWKQANKLAIETASGRIPVYSGAIAASTLQVIENIKYLESIGAQIAVVTPPFYVPSLYQSEIMRHFETVLNKTSIKLCIYNMPGLTGGIDIAPETIAELAKNERVIAYKDSCPNWDHHLRTLSALKTRDVSVFCGGEELFAASLLFGSQGNISGLAPSFPKLFVELYDNAKQGNLKKVVELQDLVLELKNINYVGKSCFSCMKYALVAVGIGNDTNCAHTEPLSDQEKEVIQNIANRFMRYAV